MSIKIQVEFDFEVRALDSEVYVRLRDILDFMQLAERDTDVSPEIMTFRDLQRKASAGLKIGPQQP